MSPAAEKAKDAYEAGERGQPCPYNADARERRLWTLGRSRHAEHGFHNASQAPNVDLLDPLNAIAVDGALTVDESMERDRLIARLKLPTDRG